MTTGSASLTRCVLLSGGIGGAKLALGLDRMLPAGDLTVIANTGDDFEHLGLAISPDLDTLMYTLADAVNPDTGWGQRDETWGFMEELDNLGGPTWFKLGDRDLAVHIERTRRLNAGESLAAVTAAFCRRLGVKSRLLPMSDARVSTRVITEQGVLGFQQYFVQQQARPIATGFEYAGAHAAAALPAALEALADPGLAAILIAPSNPWLSIAPMLALPALRQAIRAASAPVIAVSPIVGGAAIKGPTAKIMRELGLPVTAAAVARHYRELLDGFILDSSDGEDAADVQALGIRLTRTSIVMRNLDDRIALARCALDFAGTLRADKHE
jgi:LPPG:FO 2-phospho-L-lactate transferase